VGIPISRFRAAASAALLLLMTGEVGTRGGMKVVMVMQQPRTTCHGACHC
jgi:hypothetical protein